MTTFSPILQAYLSGAWTDITSDSDAGTEPEVSVTARGRSAQGARTDPMRLNFTLKNLSDDYSPRNPNSRVYGTSKGLPVRAMFGTEHLGATGGSAVASTTHTTPSITATDVGMQLVAFLAGGTGNWSGPSGMTTSGLETDGAGTTMRCGYQVVSAGATGIRTATFTSSQVAATATVVLHGASTSVVESLTSVSTTCDDITLTSGSGTAVGDWLVAIQGWGRGVNVQMPSAPVGSGWIELARSAIVSETGSLATHQQISICIRPVITAGAQSVMFLGVDADETLTADNHAQLHVVRGADDWDIRATAETVRLSPFSDVSENKISVSVEASGVSERLARPRQALRSALHRAFTGTSYTSLGGVSLLPVAYWPVEDVSGSASVAAATTDTRPGRISGGSIEFGAVYSPGSADLPDMRVGTGSLFFPLSQIPAGRDYAVGWLVQFTGTTAWTCAALTMTGSAYDYVYVTVGSNVVLTGVNSSGSTALVTAGVNLSDGLPHYIEVWVTDLAPNVTYNLVVDGASQGTSSPIGSVGVPALGKLHPRSTDNTATVGHFAAWVSPVSTTYTYLTGPAIDGYDGETAGRRFLRLCRERGVSSRVVGDPDDTQRMGPQRPAEFMALIRQCEDTSHGIVFEPRETLGLGLVTLPARYNQASAVSLDWSAREVSPPTRPTDDNRYVINDVTVTREGGTSATYEVTDGSLSVQDWPIGAGRQPGGGTYSLYTDEQIMNHASWLGHIGTTDEMRWPNLTIDIGRLTIDGKTVLARQVRALDVGQRVDVINPATWIGPDDVEQQVEGFFEVFNQFIWRITMACVPDTPYQVGVIGSTARVDTDGAELISSAVTGSATSLAVAVTDGPLWINSTDHASMFPFTIKASGAKLSVTGIPAASTVTATAGTVAHSVNANLSPGLPSHQAGDLLLLFAAIRNSGAGVPQAPAGWTRLSIFSTSSNVQVFGVIAPGTVSAPTITFTGGVAGADTSAVAVRLRGGYWTDVSRAVWRAHAQLNPSGQDITFPQMRTDCLRCAVLYFGWKADDWTGVATLAGATEVVDGSTTSGDDQGIVMDIVNLTADTSLAAGVFSVTGGTTAISRGAVVVIRDDSQTLTITQTPVNGVVKTLPAGTPVSLDRPGRLAL